MGIGYKQKLYLDSALEVGKYTENDFIEINAIFEVSDNIPQDKTDILTQLRTDYFNVNEFTVLKKKKFPKLFHHEEDNLTFTKLVKHRIHTTDEIPLHSKPFRYSPIERQETQRQITKLLGQDIIRDAPIFLVSKNPTA